jgi:serine kinase of HPr protein (carbohydrate metabolism regulator)
MAKYSPRTVRRTAPSRRRARASRCACRCRLAWEQGWPGEIERFHATAISVGGRGALIRGPSGAGKSDLAFRCLGLAPSALLREPVRLVADDQVVLTRTPPRLVATAPPTLRGRIEVRGIGILEVAAAAETDIVLVVDLAGDGPIERLPDPWPKARILGFDVPLIRLLPFENSSPLKLVSALVMAALPRVESKA